MSTRSAIARPTGPATFEGVYHHWDGYPSGVGKTLFDAFNGHFAGDLDAMLTLLIDDHPGGWSTINGADWNIAPHTQPDPNQAFCAVCHRPMWVHYAQYYQDHGDGSSPWIKAGRPPMPQKEAGATGCCLFAHEARPYTTPHGPICYGGNSGYVDQSTAAGSGCEYVYLLARTNRGTPQMTILGSYRATGEKMIGMFGCGDPKSQWLRIAVVRMNAAAPNWEMLDHAQPVTA